MLWNIAAECVSIIYLCVIWVYSRKGNLIPSLKNRLFLASFLTTFLSMSTNVLSTVLIYANMPKTVLLTWIVTLIYFAATPLMGMVYFFYTAANLFEGRSEIKRYFILASIPGAVYLVLVAATPFTKSLFDVSAQGIYTQGPLISLTYIVFYLYCFACVVLVVLRGRLVAPAIRIILFTFPVVAGLVIVFQQFYPSVILSGSAATVALLIIYLYLQNKQINIDYLTRVPNRYEMLKMIELHLRHKQEFTLIVISLRDFKAINDTYGQQSGDRLLAEVSAYFKRELGLREGEVYRYNGDEFALFLRGAADYNAVTDKINKRLERAWDVPGCTCLLSAAIGVVLYPLSAQCLQGVINGLEYAVVCAKKEPKDKNLCVCTPELLKIYQRRQAILEELENSLKADSFSVYYQPIYSVESGRFVKAEALLRMSSKKIDALYPNEFIPIAEESGLIIEITYYVLDKVCSFIKHLNEKNLEIENVNVNFSALQFTQKDLIEKMLAILARHNIECSKIKVELTESTLAENAEAISAYLHKLTELGIKVSLDDFGTGYSNLMSVLNLPFDTVKLDKSLVWLGVNNERCSIAVNNFARAFSELGMKVLAEGVENEEQNKFVIDAGCTYIQGFLYARPMPEQEFEEFLRKQGN